MGYYSALRRQRIVAIIEKKQAVLDALYDAMTDAATAIEDYKFDSNEGSQRAKRRKLEEIQKSITILEAEIYHLAQKLDGTGLVKHNLRRKPGTLFRRTIEE